MGRDRHILVLEGIQEVSTFNPVPSGADDFDARVGHGRNTALGLAADLQLASAIPGTAFVEYLTGSPHIDSIIATRWRLPVAR